MICRYCGEDVYGSLGHACSRLINLPNNIDIQILVNDLVRRVTILEIPKESPADNSIEYMVEQMEKRKYVLTLYRGNTTVLPQYWYAAFDLKFPDFDKAENEFEIGKTMHEAIYNAAVAKGYNHE